MVKNNTSSLNNEIPPSRMLNLLQRWHIVEKMAKYRQSLPPDNVEDPTKVALA